MNLIKFERGLSPKDAMSIGADKIAIDAESGSYYINGTEHIFSNMGFSRFLKSLEDMSMPNDPTFGPQIIKIRTMYSDEHQDSIETKSIHEFAGDILKYNGVFYQMPTLDEFVENGFEHLILYQYEDFLNDYEQYQESLVEAVSKMKNPIELPEPEDELSDEPADEDDIERFPWMPDGNTDLPDFDDFIKDIPTEWG